MRYQIATLLYCFNDRDEVLLMRRSREPNQGLWSPCGGKLRMEDGESPHVCACREAAEEIGLAIVPPDLRLTGIVSERAYQDASHWLMFLFEVKPRLQALPPPHPEGQFAFFHPAQLDTLDLPDTDRESIWPLFWKHRGGFFAAHCQCQPGRPNLWNIEEIQPHSHA